MIRIANAQLWVHDQEEALAYWTTKVGMEVAPTSPLPKWAISGGSRLALRASPTSPSS